MCIRDRLHLLLGHLRRPRLERDLVDRAGEVERRLVVAIVDAGPCVVADVHPLVHDLDGGHRVGNRLLRHLHTIHGQHAGATLGEPRAVILEVEHHGVSAGGNRLCALPSEAVQIDQVVGEDRFALQQVCLLYTSCCSGR